MSSLSKLGSTVGYLAIVGGALAMNAYPSSDAIEEIVVTAQKRDQALSDVNFSVQAIDGAEVEEKGILELRDLIKNIPGAAFGQSFSPNSQTVAIRGVATFVGGTDPATGYYIDDFPFSIPGLAIAPPMSSFDLDRIEIIRSPQGTLYGASAMGGIIKYVTADPDADAGFNGKIQASGSTYEDGDSSYSGNVALNIPIVENEMAARLTASSRKTGGFIDNTDPAIDDDDHNHFRQDNVRGKLLYTPSDNFSANLSIWYNEGAERNGYFSSLAFDPADRINPAPAADENRIDSKFTIGSFSFDWDLGDVVLQESFSYADYKSDLTFNFSAFGATSLTQIDMQTFTNELKLLSDYSDSPWNWIAGVFYRNIDRDNMLDFDIVGFLDSDDDLVIEVKEWAVFGELSRAFADGLIEVLIGLRYGEDKRNYDGLATTSIFLAPPINIPTVAAETFETLNPRFNITLRPNDDQMFFVNAAKGFRAGLINFSALSLEAMAVGLPGGTVDDDALWSYEIGTKSYFFDERLYLDAAAYFTDWRDAQWAIPLPSGNAVTNNVGDIQILGLDIALSYRTPIDGLVVSLSGNINSAEWDSINNPAYYAFNPSLADGEDVPSVPEKSGRIALNYSRSISGGMNLTASASYSYRDRTTDISIPLIMSGAQQIVDVQIGLEAPNDWGMVFFVKNATDEHEFTVITQGFATLPVAREIGLRLSKSFQSTR